MQIFVHLEGEEEVRDGGMERGWNGWLAGIRGAVKANEKGKGAWKNIGVQGNRGVDGRGGRGGCRVEVTHIQQRCVV